MRRWAVPFTGALLTIFAAVVLGLTLLPRHLAEFSLRPADFGEIEGWDQDDHEAALETFLAGCNGLSDLVADMTLAPVGLQLDGGRLQAACDQAMAAQEAGRGAREAFESTFDIYRVTGRTGAHALYTGYYEPVFEARHEPDSEFAYPLLVRPDDLVDVDLGRFRPDLAGTRIAGRVSGNQLVPFANRAEINNGALSGRGLELAWLADPFDSFLIHIQGSARLVFADGSSQRIGFAGQNGYTYTSIGRLLVERGELSLEEASVPAIRAWIAAHPEQGRKLLEENARYIFFRPLEGTRAPVGAMGVELTAGRSLAVDPGYIPLGLPVWVDTELPKTGGADNGTHPFRRLMVAEDTGGAITGPLRGDIYLGSGAAAGDIAGRLRAEGRLYLLVPKGALARKD